MRKMLVTLFVFLIITCINFTENEVYACSCVGGSITEKLERSDAVFTGRVIEVGGTKNGDIGKLRKYTFEVNKAWKGQITKNISIYSYDGDGASCGYKFKGNESYLVYSYLGNDGELETNFCTGNLGYLSAKSELGLLGQEIEVKNNITIENEKEGSIWAYMFISGLLLVLVLILLVYRQVKSRR
ncbi:hypothetical protein QFZ77_004083 [Paenibacillus sp. V4I3]|uniref:hypothetical protein n=1 Tax=Paenibacillus sp. V4I3 TaxID=3042305 RepID=UPI002784B4FB|nr:hypothetical protein [Paenibacillus sp. V4I3]MDQ0875424.1 hypothetical protein [Paenibacillus sp. V4I3]